MSAAERVGHAAGPESQELTAERLAGIAARTEAATAGPWCADAWEIYQGSEYVPGVSLWIGETCRGTATPEQDRADAEFVAHAREDVPALLARVSELESERHTTNEALVEQTEACRKAEARVAELEALTPAAVQTCRVCGAGYMYGQPCSACEFQARMAAEAGPSVDESAAKLRAVLAPSEAPPCEGPQRHDYRLGRDLPETGESR